MMCVDRAVPFSRTEYASLRRSLGFPFGVAFYLGGIRNGGRWHEQDIANAELWVPAHAKRLGQEYPLLPIYVGSNTPWDTVDKFTEPNGVDDGNDALSLMQQWGLSGSVCLDIEAQTFRAAPDAVMSYVHGWTKAVQAGDAVACIYGLEDFIKTSVFALDNTADVWKWSAKYIATGTKPMTPQLDPTFQDAAQFANEVRIGNVGPFDLSVMVDEFPFARLNV